MKLSFYSLLFILILSVSCKKKDTTSVSSKNNILCNPSFEYYGKGSIDSWNVIKDFSIYPDTFSTITPPHGGEFSLHLAGTKMPVGILMLKLL